MVDLYVRLINENKRTIEEIPERYRAEVQAKLDAQATI